MKKFKLGDKVRLKTDVMVGNTYNGVILQEFMVFNGSAKIQAVIGDTYVLSTVIPFMYTGEMLEAVDEEPEEIRHPLSVGLEAASSPVGGAKETDNGWISTADRLPEIQIQDNEAEYGEKVLAVDIDGCQHVGYFARYKHSGYVEFIGYGIDYMEAEALLEYVDAAGMRWHALPEPPKEGT